MNFSRALAGFLAASSTPQKWALLRPAAMLRSSSLSTEAATPPKRAYKWVPKTPERKPEKGNPELPQVARKPPLDPLKLPRPSEIPFQPQVANSIHLVGRVGVPVQLQAAPDGTESAVSVLVQERTNEFPQFWIPVIFQGDLAQIAACHLKEDDLVYITGQLTGDAPLLTVKDAHTNVQVLAHDLSFVGNSSLKDSRTVFKQDKMASDCSASVKEDSPTLHSRNDLFSNSHKLENTPKKSQRSGIVKDESLWNDLVANPQHWKDNRIKKQSGLVKPKYPDFTHTVTQSGLWLNTASNWVVSQLDGLEFGGSNDLKRQRKDHNVLSTQENGKDHTSKHFFTVKEGTKVAKSNKEKDDLWKDVLENPNKWWDNRLDKTNVKSPDFKHKDSGEGLWLNSSPSWVLPKLTPITTEKKDDRWKKATLHS